MFRVVFCDDDKEYIDNLLDEVKALISNDVIFEVYYSGIEIESRLRNEDLSDIDLLFLDIEMGDISGIEVKNNLANNERVKRIVFLTSHLEMMNVAFGLKVVKYIVKPVSAISIINIVKQINRELKQAIYFTFRDGNKNQVIDLSNVYYICASLGYTEINRGNYYSTILTGISLRRFSEMLQKYGFIQIHKKYLVPIWRIKCIKGGYVTIDGADMKLPLGRKYIRTVKTAERDYRLDLIEKRFADDRIYM